MNLRCCNIYVRCPRFDSNASLIRWITFSDYGFEKISSDYGSVTDNSYFSGSVIDIACSQEHRQSNEFLFNLNNLFECMNE